MAGADALIVLVVVAIAIEGVWMAGLSYLLWRAHRSKAAPPPEAAPDPPKAS